MALVLTSAPAAEVSDDFETLVEVESSIVGKMQSDERGAASTASSDDDGHLVYT